LAQLSKALVLASLAAAIGFESWHGRFTYPYLPHLTAAAALAGIAGARVAPRQAAAAILLFVYWVPVLFVALTARPFLPPFFVIWSGALAGLLAGDRDGLRWSYPQRWRFALVLWALVIALGWPLIAYREVDFESFALLERYHVSNTGIGGSPTMMVAWMADVAVAHLLGLLWFDWLFRRAAAPDLADLRRWIVPPLAVAATAGAALAVYQGVVNLGFLSGGLWPSMGRAAGPLLDANSFGMIAALWSAGLIAVAASRPWRIPAVVGALLCWGAVWTTGSRTALLAAFVALVPIAIALVRTAGRRRLGRREVMAGGAALAAVVVLLLVVPSKGPLNRFRHMPTFAGDAGVDWLVSEFWDRSSYGSTAAKMIASHPAAGIGLGMFHMMGAAYISVHLHEVPPDNAQNWWRHNIVELGFVGALGLIVWSVVFLVYLARTSGEGERRVPAAVIKGAIVAIGLASMIGMPAQSLPVVITFWTFAFWYTRLVDREADWPAGGLRPVAWTALLVVLGGFLGATVLTAHSSLRPPLRAEEENRPYMYGMYEPPEPPPNGDSLLWTEGHGVAAIPIQGPIMLMTVRAEHPDLVEHPVRALVKVNGQVVVDTTLHTSAPLVRRVEVGATPRALIEARADRTWRNGRDALNREIGLSISWRFALNDTGRASVPFDADHRVVQIAEQPLVEPVDVRVHRPDDVAQRRGKAFGIGALQASALRNRRSKVHVDLLEPGRDDQELERVGMERTDVRDIADVALEVRGPARGVDRLEDDRGAGTKLGRRGAQQTHQIAGLEMFHDLQRD
jgi:O-Antigen ligase